MKRIFFYVLLLATFLSSCEKETLIDTPGNLVPQTVDQDPKLPSIEVNGTLLHSESFGSPTDPMLIFLHGGPGGDYQSGTNIKQLADSGYFVIFYDQRGSGLSQRHPKETYSIQLMIDDLSAVIKYYRTSPTQKVILFGHSWGGMLAAAYINSNPDQIDGAIFAEPGGFTKELLDEYSASSRKLELFSEATNDILYADQFITGKEDEHAVLDYKLALTTSFSYQENNQEGIEGPYPFNRYGAVMLNRFIEIAEEEGFDFTPNLDQFPTKVLFLYGDLNKSYGLSFAQKEAAYFPDAEVSRIAGTGHQMLYFKWDSVQPVVLNYLNSL